jgi:hypothetical protein
MNDRVSDKIQMLKSSMRCFIYGLLGLLPVFGLPFALAALFISGRVRMKEKLFWNAARPYRLWGMVCAAIGLIFWSGIYIFVIARFFMIAQGLG